jgi:hypothetical protein
MVMKCRGFLICAALLLLSVSARAEIFTAYLSSAQEVPTNASTATGYAVVTVNEAAGTLSFKVVFTGLSSTQTASHIHAPAAIGANIGVAINFGAVGGTSGTITGSTTITPTQLAQLRAHLGYVNVHSTNFSGGEIRGQLGVSRPVDDDGDGRTDYSVLRFPNVAPPGVAGIDYWNLNSTSGVQTAQWGDANKDYPSPGDFDGDGKTDLSLYRAGATDTAQSEYWVLLTSDFTYRYFAWGLGMDINVARDYDGDGKTDVAVMRPGAAFGSPAYWYIRNSATNTVTIRQFGTTGDVAGGTSGDVPVPGDYDGDGKFDLALYRWGGLTPNNTFIVLRSSDGAITYQPFGNFNSDYMLPGDYDGDGKTDYCAARTGSLSTSPLVWWILQSSNGQVRAQTFGRTSDLPTQGDYDGDARTDISIYRPGATASAPSVFWVFRSFDNTPSAVTWGLGGDYPTNTFDAR